MENPRHWRIQKQRYSLAGEICPHCDGKIFPPRPVCPYCGNGYSPESIAVRNNPIEISEMLMARVEAKAA